MAGMIYNQASNPVYVLIEKHAECTKILC